jgi:hemolysin D
MSAEIAPDNAPPSAESKKAVGSIEPKKVAADTLPPEPLGPVRDAVVTEFQPDAVEVEERSPPILTHYMMYAMVTLMALLILWSCIATMDKVVTTTGKLVTDSPHIVLQPLETSIIRTVAVKAGQSVKKGDVLLTLDPTFAEADLADVESRNRSYTAEIRRLDAELADTPYVMPPEPTADDILQETLYRRRQASYQAQLTSYDEEIRRFAAAVASADTDFSALTDRLRVIDKIVDMRQELAQKEVGSRLNLLIAQNEQLTINGNLDRARNARTETKAALDSALAKREAFIQQWRQEIATKLVEQQRQANQVTEMLNKAQLRQSLVTLTAPEDAIVLETANRTVGAVVDKGDPLVTLVPTNAPLQVEVRIPLAQIGFLTVGQPARIKLQAYPFQRHGTLDGILQTISEDSFTERNQPDVQYYKGTVEITTTDLRNVPPTFRLIPGMSATAEVKVGDRRVITYFLYPIFGALDQAFNDPRD